MKIVNIDQKFVHGVGFSNGCAAFALKKPPPFVPSCLMVSWLATGPIAIVCFAPSSVVTSRYGLKFWIMPCCTNSSDEHEAERQQHVERAAHEIDPEVADAPFASGRAARCRARARRRPPCPTAADAKL